MLVPRAGLDQIVEAGNDTLRLHGRSSEFSVALKQEKSEAIYRLFNSRFRAEVGLAEFDTAFRKWVRNRPVSLVLITHIELHGISGLVSTNVYFDAAEGDSVEPGGSGRNPCAYDFLFQYWVKTGEGWELMWVNKILDPVAQDYGRSDTLAARQIVQMALNGLITDQGLQAQLRLSRTPDTIVLLDHGPLGPDYRTRLQGRTTLWMTRDSIYRRRQELGIKFYIDVQPMRVLKDVAMGTFDVIPLAAGPGAPTHPRSLKLLFVRKQGKWTFADYGANW
jgi:hypothetical protein